MLRRKAVVRVLLASLMVFPSGTDTPTCTKNLNQMTERVRRMTTSLISRSNKEDYRVAEPQTDRCLLLLRRKIVGLREACSSSSKDSRWYVQWVRQLSDSSSRTYAVVGGFRK